jgi:hypothetical protein
MKGRARGSGHGVNAGLDEDGHVIDGALRIDLAMVAGQLPAPANQAGNLVAGGQKGAFRGHGASCSGTAVVSE